MNDKICGGTVVSTESYMGIDAYPEDLAAYDPNGILFPRDGAYAGQYGYNNAFEIAQSDGYDSTRADAFFDMTGLDFANEGCLIEFEFHDFATSESTTSFCCQAFSR